MTTQNLRAAAPQPQQVQQFGPLIDLSGTWVGKGFNLISKPAAQLGLPFVLQVNATLETLEFTPIQAPIPNRGSVQDDIIIFGHTYQQRVSEANTFGLLHIEEGMWISVPPTNNPSQPATVVRLGTIPHGDSILAQGTAIQVSGQPPQFEVADPTPFPGPTPPPPGYFPPPPTLPNTNPPQPFPPGFNLQNINQALQDAIQGQTILDMIILEVSTSANPPNPQLPPPFGGGIVNIPFVNKNANAVELDATFWIETVAPPAGSPPDTPPTMQLQYTQTVILNFLGINWPHISVATLVKQ
jgi:hypothetical protein